MTFGRPEFAEENRLINATLGRQLPLVVAHRGVAAGTVVENTSIAVSAAFLSGAGMVEIDATMSRDGEFYAFHDGLENKHFGIHTNLQNLSAAEISSLKYHADGSELAEGAVEKLGALLASFAGKSEFLFNLDRSWPWWTTLLPLLDQLHMTQQLLLKAPADSPQIKSLAEHPVKYPFMPICRTSAEAWALTDEAGLNMMGVELLADSPEHEFARSDTIEAFAKQGLFVFVNAENVDSETPLFAGFDDATSLQNGFDQGWGELLGRGVHAIQTDWPWLLSSYAAECMRGAGVQTDG
ncbi:glycerophosphodiester phosphodiesterase family protein [Corynebacterium epidermidicanis]|uniref:Glycerophosphoryl diester phosphodiesterase n=1 Tax=Corynebacterium epidermidicanis TaxID=1050174 RepID=A0A0G3GY25_9CORY|nr:glycerophosphodiester phosphodiesterase family protein [Corynebacterium epidermidicanis]AKK03727.1 glycerophosphoryl diester phosphodiesterase [Corynebacterium epidermidicanis]